VREQENAMNASGLTALLFGPGLPVTGYDFSSQPEDERDAMVAALLATPGIALTEAPMVTMVEVEADGAIWLVTQPGHVAHPSLLRRALAASGAGRVIETTGWTAADPAVMRTWVEQFRTQDALQRPPAPA
jgi:hypothetical protein